MKKILLVLCLCVACVKIETYDYLPTGTYVFHVIPSPECNYELSEEFIYDWKEQIGYTNPDSLFADLYRNGKYYVTKACDTSLVDISENDQINVIISNLKLNGIEYISHETYSDSGFEFIEKYPYCRNIDDIFIGVNDFKADLSKYEWDDSTAFYYTPIITEIHPITKIYFVQIISDLQDIICDSLMVSGISISHNFKVSENIIGNMWIPLKEKQIINNESVYAARFLSFGIPDSKQEEYSWDISATLKCYVAFKANNRYVKVDITKKMFALKNGGVITVHINKEDLKGDGTFDLGVGDWNVQEIEINL